MKKIPYYPSRWEAIKELLKIYVPNSGERIVDLGSGDARVLTTLALRYDDIRLVGVEKDPKLVLASNRRIRRLNLANIDILQQDLFKYPITRENIDTIYAYLTKDALRMLKPKLQEFIKNDGLIILLDFKIPGLKPDLKTTIKGLDEIHKLFIYGNKRRLRQINL